MSALPDLLYTDVEDDLRGSVRSLLTDRCPPSTAMGCYEERPPDPGLWRAVAVDLGLAGLLVPEKLGGSGATAREAAVVLEELGRFVAPVPFLTSAVLATTALVHVGDDRLLPRLAGGELTAAPLVPAPAAPAAPAPAVSRADDGSLHGLVRSVPDAGGADVLVVPVGSVAGVELHHVPTRAAGVHVVPVVSLDMTRQLFDVELSGVAADPLGGDGDGAAALRTALVAGAALLTSEQVGVAEWCLDTTVAYVRERRQFGRPVGSFQALKHRLADVWLEVSSARASARYAAACLVDAAARPAPGPASATGAVTEDVAVAASLAQAYCAEVAVHAAEECVQMHGGVGMTWEHPAHLYLKRAKADAVALGTAGHHRALLATMVDLPGPRADEAG